ncbi:MAG: hypothetical protein PPP56_11530 [Longimonas sp.]|uniref:hypothetical protein n=1 Tax=Longimonas sp. TaxID=2039626 RepID=UPI0033453DF0
MRLSTLTQYATCFVLVFALALTTGCDTVDSAEDLPDPYADIQVSAPLSATIDGQATLGGSESFGEQGAMVFPFEDLGITLTAIQLFGEDGEGIAHNLSFVYIGEDRLSEGTYDIDFDLPCQDLTDCQRSGLFFGERLMTNYVRAASDSLHTYVLQNGMLTVEHATDDAIEGTFAFEAAVEVSTSRADLEAFYDSLRTTWPTGGNRYEDMPEFPPQHRTPLTPPATVEGSFAATPGEFPNTMGSSFGWIMRGGIFSRTQ